MTKIWAASAGWLLAAVAAGSAASLVDRGADERDALMREKLELTQKVLAGLAKSELETAGREAAALAAEHAEVDRLLRLGVQLSQHWFGRD